MRPLRPLLVAAAVLGIPGTALADAGAPANDNRANATTLAALPQQVTGTTADASTEANEPVSGCADTSASVWYALATGATPPDRIGIKLAANGNLDAAVDVYRQQRSQLEPVACRRTDQNGQTALAFPPLPHTTYLIRVAQRADSQPGTFSLQALPLAGRPQPPGQLLGPRGVNGVLDGTLDTTAAYSMDLTAGTVYRLNLVKPNQGCMSLSIFAPGTTSFSDTSLGGLSCGGYRLFTPRTSGRWSFLISADPNNPGTQRFGLHIAPATSAETAPGIYLPNLGHIRGVLRGNVIDDVRLFRFDVTRHSDLRLFLQAASNAPFDLKLLNDRGHYIQCNCGSSGEETIRRQVGPGRYFVVVQAEGFGSGPFTLYRQSRLITHVSATIDGKRSDQVTPGTAMQFAAHITPAVDGPVTIEVDSFDPVEHWQFYRYYHVTAVSGLARLPFVAPYVGRWRATVTFDGTNTASPATTGFVHALVAGPLEQ